MRCVPLPSQVILTSPDFDGGNNPPNEDIHNTEPEFIVVGSELSSVEYVLVMDTSMSMFTDPSITNPGSRINSMVDAAKRWVKFDLPDDVNLGVVTFADEEKIIPFVNMTQINDENRDVLVDKLSEVVNMVGGQTCIGCGLMMAADYIGMLNRRKGGNVLLITDGQQKCKYPSIPEICISMAEMTEVFLQRNIRVVTIAIGPDADTEIEDLAQKTGGKSFYVEVVFSPALPLTSQSICFHYLFNLGLWQLWRHQRCLRRIHHLPARRHYRQYRCRCVPERLGL